MPPNGTVTPLKTTKRDHVVFRFASQPAESVIHPSKFVIDCSSFDVSNSIPESLQQKIRENFESTGLVWLTKTGLTSLEDMSRLARVIIENPMQYKGGANSRNSIVGSVYETGAPLVADLHYHHEMAYVSKSTKMLAFCCLDAVEGKGWTYVSDQVGLTEEILQTKLGQKLKEKGLCYVRSLTDRKAYENAEGKSDPGKVYNHWQQSFGVETVEEVEREAHEKGLKTEWGVDPQGNSRYLITKFYVSAFEFCPATNKNIMYSSIADDAAWFDSWPGLMDMDPKDRPLELLYGDGSKISREEAQEWVDLYAKYGIPIQWSQGDIAIVCNWRWAHGRPSIDMKEGEKRNLGVILGDTFDRVGDLEGKW